VLIVKFQSRDLLLSRNLGALTTETGGRPAGCGDFTVFLHGRYSNAPGAENNRDGHMFRPILDFLQELQLRASSIPAFIMIRARDSSASRFAESALECAPYVD
jgi:hypothetical protein